MLCCARFALEKESICFTVRRQKHHDTTQRNDDTIYNQYLIQIIVVISFALYCGVPAF